MSAPVGSRLIFAGYHQGTAPCTVPLRVPREQFWPVSRLFHSIESPRNSALQPLVSWIAPRRSGVRVPLAPSAVAILTTVFACYRAYPECRVARAGASACASLDSTAVSRGRLVPHRREFPSRPRGGRRAVWGRWGS